MAAYGCNLDTLSGRPGVAATKEAATPGTPLSIVRMMIGDCFCGPIAASGDLNGSTTQFIELHGIEFIGLGAVTDELSAKERVYDTLEQLTERTQRLISIGYLVTDPTAPEGKSTESIPLDVWNKSFPNDRTMSRSLRRTISFIKKCDFENAMKDLIKEYGNQKRRPMRNNNSTILGITAHNIGVVCVLAGKDEEAIPYFREAISLKKKAFGHDHPEVAVSLDELGIQLFANEKFAEALAVFNESRKILSKWYGSTHPRLCMLLNNIACCTFQIGNTIAATLIMHEARELQRAKSESSGAKVDLDLLHLAILANNYGYLKAQQKHYEEARACFEEAMLIQQSVYGDEHHHRAIHDSRSNLDFVNAFHS